MIATFRKEKSKNGFSLDVLKSGIQKYIRRGNIEKALYCVGELDMFAEVAGGERIRTNMIHRLMVIYLEDIGLGNISLWKAMDEWCFRLLKARKLSTRDRKEEIQLLHNIVVSLCRSNKTRALSHIKNALISDNELDWIVDFKIAARHMLFVIQNHQDRKCIESFLETKCEAALKHVPMDMIRRWAKEIPQREKFLVYLFPLAVYFFGGIINVVCDSYRAFTRWSNDEAIELDNFVYDKHVQRPRDAAIDYFMHVSSIVSKEKHILPLYFKDHYVAARLNYSERRVFQFVVRAQLVCSHNRQDTYYAMLAGEFVFVKGPFANKKIVERFIELQKEKERNSMPFVPEARCIMLFPDMWESTPIGARNQLDKTKKQPFLICRSLIRRRDLEFEEKESKLWQKTTVVKRRTDIIQEELRGQALNDYMNNVGFRLKYNLGDLAERNFMLVDGRIYSIDEQTTQKKINIYTQMNARRIEFIKNHIDDCSIQEYKECIASALEQKN